VFLECYGFALARAALPYTAIPDKAKAGGLAHLKDI